MDFKQKLKLKKDKGKKTGKTIKVNLAILGGGDVVFPIILAGTVLAAWGLTEAIMVALGATIALTLLFKFGQKGKPYPAMPFIGAGCFLGLLVVWLIGLAI